MVGNWYLVIGDCLWRYYLLPIPPTPSLPIRRVPPRGGPPPGPPGRREDGAARWPAAGGRA
ncbi:MAG: hypothetical protein AAFQ89_13900, partial [Cyanobacteria bacterium J06626_18]